MSAIVWVAHYPDKYICNHLNKFTIMKEDSVWLHPLFWTHVQYELILNCNQVWHYGLHLTPSIPPTKIWGSLSNTLPYNHYFGPMRNWRCQPELSTYNVACFSIDSREYATRLVLAPVDHRSYTAYLTGIILGVYADYNYECMCIADCTIATRTQLNISTQQIVNLNARTQLFDT